MRPPYKGGPPRQMANHTPPRCVGHLLSWLLGNRQWHHLDGAIVPPKIFSKWLTCNTRAHVALETKHLSEVYLNLYNAQTRNGFNVQKLNPIPCINPTNDILFYHKKNKVRKISKAYQVNIKLISVSNI